LKSRAKAERLRINKQTAVSRPQQRRLFFVHVYALFSAAFPLCFVGLGGDAAHRRMTA
jgi:hypothetical protein